MRPCPLPFCIAISQGIFVHQALAQSPPSPPVAAPAPAQLRVVVDRPFTTVLLDGVRVGTAPIEVRTSPGMHRLHLSTDGYKPWEGPVATPPDARTVVRTYFEPLPDRTAAYGVLLTGAALFVTSALLFTATELERASLRRDVSAGTLDDRDPRIDRGNALAVSTAATLALALGVGVTATVLFLWDDTAPTRTRVHTRTLRALP